jgi:Fic family protein
MYIYELKGWPEFNWEMTSVVPRLGEVRHRQGLIIGQMDAAGFDIKESALLDTLTLDVTKSSEIEGEQLDAVQVRSSIANRLGIDIGGAVPSDRNVDGVVAMMLDATQQYDKPLTKERLFGWHSELFPTGRSGMQKITVGDWRTPEAGPMQVVSGPMGRRRVHFEAPDASLVPREMSRFLDWFNADPTEDAVMKAAIAHLWFVTIHPFDDGNGRIARAISDLQLARSDGSPQRFYSMSAQILKEKQGYYDLLESTQKGNLDITAWIKWFLDCLYHAMDSTEETLKGVLERKRFWEKYRDVSLNARQQLMISKMLDGFFGKLTSGKWAKMMKTSTDTALRDIQDLLDKGILEKEPGGGRSTNYRLVR